MFRELSGEAGHAGGFAGGAEGALQADTAFSGPLILPPERIGIQLYTVRDAIQSLGFATVFQTLAAIGYKQVEFAGYTQGTGAITTTQIRQLMDANGLVGIGSHVMPSAGSMEQILDDAQILGLPYVGVSLVVPANTTVSGWQQTAEEYNTYGAAAAARGIGFYFHNHFQEWTLTEQPPTRGIDVLLAETTPGQVFWAMDIYWAYVGQFQSGQPPFPFDPLTYATQNRARIPFFHVKDGRRNQTSPLGYDIVDVAEGHVDFENFFCTVGQQNRLYYLFEHDNAANHPQGSLVSAKFSYIQMRYGMQGCDQPTAVVVRDFAALARGRRVALSWRTSSEANLLGFNVWRFGSGRSHRVNRALIRSEHAGRPRGADYRFVDRSARKGVPYTYRLQLVNRDGTRSWAGSTSITA
jgi:sugar phosphate isomerase/epimerase